MAPITLLDGGLGHLLKSKGVDDLAPGLAYEKLFLATTLAVAEAPHLVQEAHQVGRAALLMPSDGAFPPPQHFLP